MVLAHGLACFSLFRKVLKNWGSQSNPPPLYMKIFTMFIDTTYSVLNFALYGGHSMILLYFPGLTLLVQAF